MALAGSIKTNGYDGRYYTLSWTATQSITANTSTVSWTLACAGGDDNWYAERTVKAVINGTTVFSKSERVERKKGTIKTGTIIVPHNTDGAKSIAMSLQVACYTTAVNLTASNTFTLNQIPRGARITSAPNFNDEENPTITYSNPAGNAATSLQVCISLDGSTADIAYRSVNKTGSTYTFNLTEAERNILRNATTTANSRTVYFYIWTTIGEFSNRSRVEKTLSIINAKPTLNPYAIDVGSGSTALTGDGNNKIIKYYNYVNVGTGATAQKGATIKSYKISNGGKSISTASGSMGNVESGSFVFSATDSRGNTTVKTLEKTLIDYIKPTCNLEVAAPTTDGALTLTISGNYFNGSFGAVQNTLTVYFRYKVNSGSYGAWQTATATYSGNTYKSNVNITGLDYRSSYTFQARVIDAIYNGNTEPSIDSAEKTVKTTPIFDWGKDDLKFNVPVEFAAGVSISGNSGEWKPTLNASAVSSYTNQYGWYQKNGNVITVGFYVKATCKSGYEATGISISGLPFAPSVSSAGGGMCSGCYVSSGFTFQCWVAGTNSTITARVQQVNHTTATNLSTSASGCFYRSNGGEITLSGTITYITT